MLRNDPLHALLVSLLMPNVEVFSDVLHDLYRAGRLFEPRFRDPVMTFIRRASETPPNYHADTHFRSEAADAAIRAAKPTTITAFKRLPLRHEHVVPCAAIYEMLLAQHHRETLTRDTVHDTLRQYSLRATITLAENTRLDPSRMPREFFEADSLLYLDPMARYKKAGIAVIPRCGDRWDDWPAPRRGIPGQSVAARKRKNSLAEDPA